jgi:hypothetical protein
MADLIIKPSAVADSFKMNDANSSANTILTVEGQTDSGVTTAGRIIYGKGVNETLGTASQASAVITIDLATGTFFEHQLTEAATTWKILHLPQAGTIAAWVVKLQNGSSAYANTWTANAASTYDTNADPVVFAVCTPVFHWAGGTDHVLSTGVTDFDILAFWTKGGDDPVIYSTISGQDFLT